MRLLRFLLTAALFVGIAQAGVAGYTIKKGDTLSAISRRLHVPMSALAEANGIKNADLIRFGTVLRLPGAAAPPSTGSAMVGTRVYVVARGDNLAGIASKFSTTVGELVKLNNIKHPDVVTVGAKLTLPGGQWVCPVRGHYTVVSNWGAPRPGNIRHEGDDIFADRGSLVIAPVSGVLRQVQGKVAGNAFYLAGDDGNTYYFAHLDSYLHGPGRIDAGGVMGKVGNTGDARTTPPHLHFEIHPNNAKAADPFPTLRRWC
jgi:murein DD-endopeptidase MepM/ murein hydrolase activator NlpD